MLDKLVGRTAGHANERMKCSFVVHMKEIGRACEQVWPEVKCHQNRKDLEVQNAVRSKGRKN